MEKIGTVIIGAGAVGLSIAYELSKTEKDIVVLEKNEKFGQETSSRNSEVIHAGIYYPEDSLKAKLCVQGKLLLYEFLEKHNLPYRRCGKFIAAVDKSEIEALQKLKEKGEKNQVNDLEIYSKEKMKQLIPELHCEAAIFSPSTGIFDTHKFMQKLEFLFEENGGIIEYNAEVIGIEKDNNGYKVVIKDADGENFEFFAERVINSAGLNSDKIARMVGIEKFKLYYSKGEYFRLPSKYYTNSLIYPVTKENFHSLGAHICIDLYGGVKVGPNNFYVDKIDYSVDESHREEFYQDMIRFFPFSKKDELSPDMAGIRPKLQGPADKFRDFVIAEDLEGFINLVGIESPGLTASLAIARYVKKLISDKNYA